MSIRIENIQVDNLNLGNDLVLESNTADMKMAQVGTVINNYYHSNNGSHAVTGAVDNTLLNELKNLNGYTKASTVFHINKTFFPKLKIDTTTTPISIDRARVLAIGTSSFGFLSRNVLQKPVANIEITNDNIQTMTTYTNESIIRTGNPGNTTMYDCGSSWNDLSNPGRSIFAGAGLSCLSTYNYAVNLVCYDGTQWREIWTMPTASISGSRWFNPSHNSAYASVTYQNHVITISTKDYIRYWTDNYGASWQLSTNAGAAPPSDFQIHRMSNGVFYVYQLTGARCSFDDGKSWKHVATMPATASTEKTSHMMDTNGTTVVMVVRNSTMFYSNTYNTSSVVNGWQQNSMTGPIFSPGHPRHVYWCDDLFIALNGATGMTASVATNPSGSFDVGWTLRHVTGSNTTFPPNYAMKCGNRYWIFSDFEVRFASASNLNSWSLAYTLPSNDSNTNGSDKQVGSVYKNANGFIHAAGASGLYYYDIATNTIRSASSQQFTSDYYSGQAIPTNFSYMKIR